jgi:hypothetical protein
VNFKLENNIDEMHLYELLLYGISNWGYPIDTGRYIRKQWRMVCPKATVW